MKIFDCFIIKISADEILLVVKFNLGVCMKQISTEPRANARYKLMKRSEKTSNFHWDLRFIQ